MSCYIVGATDRDSPRFFKADYLCDDFGATPVPQPDEFAAPPGKVYIAVIENPHFDAAMVVLTEGDLLRVKYELGGRGVTWLLMDRLKVRSMVDARYRNEPALQ